MRIWEVASRRVVTTFQADGEIVRALAFSPDGRLLVAGISGLRDTAPDRVQIWDVSARREVATLRSFPGAVWQVAFSPNGAILATGSQDEPVRLWDVATWKERVRTTLPLHSPSLAYSPDGRLLASGAFDEGHIGVWDLVAQRSAASLSTDQMGALSVAFSPDGKTLAGCMGLTIRMWNTATWRPTITLRLELSSEGPRWVGFSPDGETLAIGCHDNTIRFWRAPLLSEALASGQAEG